jgi:hypothetical protein
MALIKHWKIEHKIQGDEGKSWYIILKGSVNVVIYGKVMFIVN